MAGVTAVALAGAGDASSARSGAASSAQARGTALAASAATTTPPVRGFSPQTLQRAYGVSPLLRKGVDGRGETVVLPEAALGGSGNIRQDLAAFDERYHLPRVDLTLTRALGYTGDTSLADGEEVLDAEMVHAIAPGAKITIMLSGLRAFAPPELASLLRAAAGRGNVVSLSYGVCEPCLSAGRLRSVDRALRYARDRHVSVIAAAGDNGATGTKFGGGPTQTRGVELPVASPLVTGVGGTSLVVRRDGAYASESVWDTDHGLHLSTGAELTATAGGASARYARPGYQHGLPAIGDHRGVPDVAAVADPGLAVAVVRNRHVFTGAQGGTSASTPLWAGIAALADQDAHRQLGFLNEGLYRIGHGRRYDRAFHDITHGDNTVTWPSTGRRITGYRARRGWDPVTGWGSPNAQVLVPLLGNEVRLDDGRGL